MQAHGAPPAATAACSHPRRVTPVWFTVPILVYLSKTIPAMGNIGNILSKLIDACAVRALYPL
jgi:hypothetical protein